MTGDAFTALVLSALTRATAEEREEVRRELEEHMEDRTEALLETGLDPESAEAQSVAAMGDPLEIGRALNRQYSPGWLWLGRAAVVLTAALCVQAVFALGLLAHAWSSLEARIYPDIDTRLETVEAAERLDLRMEIGNDVMRVFRVSVGEREGQRVAEVSMCAYDRLPFGIVMDNWWNKVTLGEAEAQFHSGNGRGNYGAEYWQTYVLVGPGDRSVPLTYEGFGTIRHMEIPLPEQEDVS